MDIIKNTIFSAITVAALSGCASSQFNAEEVKSPNYQQSSNHILYADLTEKEGKWRIENIKNENTKLDSTLALGTYKLLNEKRLAGSYDECTISLWIDWDKCSNNQFVEKGFSNKTFTSVVGFLFIPYLWVPFGFPINLDQSFNWEEYHDAINSAKQRDDYDHNYPSVYKNYVTALQSVKSYSVTKTNKGHYEERSSRLLLDKQQELTSLAARQIRVTVKDETGIVNVSSIHDLSNHISANAQLPQTPKFFQHTLIPFIDEQALINDIFPAKSLSELEEAVNKFPLKIAKAQEENQIILSKNLRAAKNINLQNKVIFDKYSSNLAKNNAHIYLSDKNNIEQSLNNYDVKYAIPSKVKLTNGKLPNGFNIPIVIKGKHFTDILPKTFSNQNDELRIQLNNKTLKITNYTNKFITLDALSLYHKKDILTRGGDKFQNMSELAPGSVTTFNLYDFNLSSLDDDYRSLTKKEAKRTYINFGFAAKYRITGDVNPRSLYKLNSYNLYDII